MTICAGLFLSITKLSSDDLPIGALVAITMLCDFLLAFLTLIMLSDSSMLQSLVAILGSCR